MAMLAEPRRRQKWSLNPRGADWANDDNKFGQKLMEKMGWSKGKGLGREEQGVKEHISLKFKDNSKGLGYSGKDDEWIKHYEGFEDVLSALNSEHNSVVNSKNGSLCNSSANSDEEIDQKNKKSLEARSKVSKARVHYHKFTRGKDLSRYNEDDIACILGSKRAKKLAESKTNEESTTEGDEIGHVDNLNGVTTIKGCSVKDYFAQKMDAFKKNFEKRPQKVETNICTEEAEESTVRHGFGFDSNIEGEENATTVVVNKDERSTQSSSKKRKKQNEKMHKYKQNEGKEKINQLEEEENLENEKGIENNNVVGESKDGGRKKKKQLKDKKLCENHQIDNIPLAESNTKSKKKKNVSNIDKGIDSESLALYVNELKLKKNNKKSKSSTEENYHTGQGDVSVEGEIDYTNHKKKKKRKRHEEDLKMIDKEIDIFGTQKKIEVRKGHDLDQGDIRGSEAEGTLSDMQLKKRRKRNKSIKQK